MRTIDLILLSVGLFLLSTNSTVAQKKNKFKISGEMMTDERVLVNSPNDWAWNENRLTLKLGKKVGGKTNFYSEVWLRNIGIPSVASSADLYNKGIIDPWNIELRELYVEFYGLFSKNLDVKIGRQIITWGTADKLNPTDNLNPYDLEDILDFGRHRGTEAFKLDYYFGSDFSIQGVYIPFFRPTNMPVGIFATALNPSMDLPQGMSLMGLSDELHMSRYNLKESSTTGFKFKGFAKGVDFSLSYIWGRDGLPFATRNTFTPVDTVGGITIHTDLNFYRTHIFGIDLATDIKGVGVWAEAAVFLPEHEVVMTNDLSELYPLSPVPVTQDTTVLKKEPYVKFVVGLDYNFAHSIYLNFQYLHGFMNERGTENINDYFFLQLQKKFFEDKLKIAPISGGFIVSDWKDVKNNYAFVYVPSISYMATDNAELIISAAIFDGKGANIFASLSKYSMVMFKLKYSF